MALNDPLGDMIARIHNAQMRNKSKVSIPASRLRLRVLDVLKSEGFIRGYASVEHANGRHELEVELKYFDGEPVIREISRVSKPGRRVYASVKALLGTTQTMGVSTFPPDSRQGGFTVNDCTCSRSSSTTSSCSSLRPSTSSLRSRARRI